MSARRVSVSENGDGPFGQNVTIGRHRLVADEPREAGGLDSGPDPFAYVLAGLGACTAMTLRLYANRKGWDLGPIAVDLVHHREFDDGAEIHVIDRTVRIAGDVDADRRRRLNDIADRCPVGRMIAAGARITTTIAEPAATL
jgi:putative redox protein